MFTKILVGLDGSPRQPDVIARAAELAVATKAELHLCRAVTIPAEVPPAIWTFEGAALDEFLLEHAIKSLTRVRDGLDPGIVKDIHARVGQPADVLCTIAADIGASLIVIGSHGYSGIDRLLGTTAAKVANRAPCSVLVVRRTAP